MFTKPEQNILHLGLKEGMRVADFGAGSGFYSRAISLRVGNSGKVYAIEVQKDLVKKLEHDFKNEGLSNISCIWGDVEAKGGTKLSDNSMDVVVISNIMFLVDDKIGLIDEAHRVLKKTGVVLFIDWLDMYGDNNKNLFSREKAKDLFEKRGFKVEENLITNINHYGIIFRYE